MEKFLVLCALLAFFGGVFGYFYLGVLAKMFYIALSSALVAFAILNYKFVMAYGLRWLIGYPLVVFTIFFLTCTLSLLAGYWLKRLIA